MGSTQRVRASHEGAQSRYLRRRRDAEVLEAATAVFHRRGYANASVQDVADVLGMLKGSLYYYIKSKEELLYRIATRVHDDVDALMDQVMQERGSSFERIQSFVRRQVAYNVRNLDAIAVYHHDTHHLSKSLRADIRKRWQKHQDLLVALIESAQAEGDIDPAASADLLSHCVFAPIIWMYRWYGLSLGVSVEELQDTCVQLVSAGIYGHGYRESVPLSR